MAINDRIEQVMQRQEQVQQQMDAALTALHESYMKAAADLHAKYEAAVADVLDQFQAAMKMVAPDVQTHTTSQSAASGTSQPAAGGTSAPAPGVNNM